MAVPLKYASADSQWTGTVTIKTTYNDTSTPEGYSWPYGLYENGTFTFSVATDGIITGGGQETLVADVVGTCYPDLPSPTFSVKGNLLQNSTDFALLFTNFSQSKMMCNAGLPPTHPYSYIIEPSLLKGAIKVPAKDGGTYQITKPSIAGNGQQSIMITINENSNPTPEFGSVATTVLLISILSIIILSVKTRFLH